MDLLDKRCEISSTDRFCSDRLDACVSTHLLNVDCGPGKPHAMHEYSYQRNEAPEHLDGGHGRRLFGGRRSGLARCDAAVTDVNLILQVILSYEVVRILMPERAQLAEQCPFDVSKNH